MVRVLITQNNIEAYELLESHFHQSVNQEHKSLIASTETDYNSREEELEDIGLLECDPILLGEYELFLMFQRIAGPSSSGSRSPTRTPVMLQLHDPDERHHCENLNCSMRKNLLSLY